jgi:hypothetical protein
MILRNTNLFDLLESFTIEVPEDELKLHLEKAKRYNGFEISQSMLDPKHCHGLKTNLDFTKQFYWDAESDIFIAFKVELLGNYFGNLNLFGNHKNISPRIVSNDR